jgi:hypothetical protein
MFTGLISFSYLYLTQRLIKFSLNTSPLNKNSQSFSKAERDAERDPGKLGTFFNSSAGKS